MGEPPLPGFLVAGTQKCASTWLYNCLDEHPEVLVPDTDSVHYFDIYYHKGERWYRNWFSEYSGETVVGETTPTYMRHENAPERIAESVPDVKIIFLVRNPVDRAYSHWWHEKSKDKHSFDFGEVLENYDLFQNWVGPGFYHHHLMRYAEHIPERNIKVCLFDDLAEDDRSYVQDVYSFLGVDDDFVPSLVDEKVNQGKFRAINRQTAYMAGVRSFKRIAPRPVVNILRPGHRHIRDFLASQTEYEEGMDDEVRGELEQILVDDIRRLSDYLGRDLGHWLKYHEL